MEYLKQLPFLDKQFQPEQAGNCEHCGDLIVQSEQKDHLLDVCEHVPKEIKDEIARFTAV